MSKVDVDMYDVAQSPQGASGSLLGGHTLGKQSPLLTAEEFSTTTNTTAGFKASGVGRCSSVSSCERMLMPRASMGALHQASAHGMSRVGRYASARASSIFSKR